MMSAIPCSNPPRRPHLAKFSRPLGNPALQPLLRRARLSNSRRKRLQACAKPDQALTVPSRTGRRRRAGGEALDAIDLKHAAWSRRRQRALN
jgi:hypothetical protein